MTDQVNLNKMTKAKLIAYVAELQSDLAHRVGEAQEIRKRLVAFAGASSQDKLTHSRELSTLTKSIANITNVSNYNDARARVLIDAVDTMRDALLVFSEESHWPANTLVAGVAPHTIARTALNNIAVKVATGSL